MRFATVGFDVGSEVAKNLLMSAQCIRRWRTTRPRTTPPIVADSLVFREKAVGCLDLVLRAMRSVKGLDILEVGPGDTLVSGLCFLAAGARSYTAVDRFAGNYSGPVARSWYRKAKQLWGVEHPNLSWPNWLDPTYFPECCSKKVKVYLTPIEEETDIGSFDVVCSHDVGEHVRDIQRFARASMRHLRLSGVAIHGIDFGPHGPWTKYEDPHMFLYIPELLWQLMGSARGCANRFRMSEFRAAFESVGLKVEIPESSAFDCMPNVKRLPRRLRQLEEVALMTARATFVCHH